MRAFSDLVYGQWISGDRSLVLQGTAGEDIKA